MKRWVLAFSLLALVGCEVPGKPIETSYAAANSDGKVTVQQIAIFDGIILYRVNIPGERNVYVAVREGNKMATTKWTEVCGKGCTQEVGVDGVQR